MYLIIKQVIILLVGQEIWLSYLKPDCHLLAHFQL